MDEIKEYGQVKLDHNNNHKNIFLLSIIGEIEGHENVASGTKATKYEHILPMLAKIEDDQDIDGLLIILNTLVEMWSVDLPLRNDCKSKQTDSFTGAWRKPFNRSAVSGIR